MSLLRRPLRACRFPTAATIVLWTAATAGAQPVARDAFDAHFHRRTMRLDYFHTGGTGQEIFSLDRIAHSPTPFGACQQAGKVARLPE